MITVTRGTGDTSNEVYFGDRFVGRVVGEENGVLLVEVTGLQPEPDPGSMADRIRKAVKEEFVEACASFEEPIRERSKDRRSPFGNEAMRPRLGVRPIGRAQRWQQLSQRVR